MDMDWKSKFSKKTYQKSLRCIKLSIGQELNYLLYNKNLHVKLIKVTKKGYNLLNVDTNKCILKAHLYPCKKAIEQMEEINVIMDYDSIPIAFLMPYYRVNRISDYEPKQSIEQHIS